MSDSESTLLVQNVTKAFGDFVAVNDLTFDVKPGRVFGFLGPNGAGKTTSIRMIVGITAPDSGSVKLFGESISAKTQDRIGYLPEERGLYKKMKVVDQLRYFAALKGIARRDADVRIDRWLARMELSNWRDNKTTDLSKGMQQKIQFISTVIHDPDLLILDEPFSGLDPVNVEFMIGVLSELRASNKTIIFSTHLMETAERLCHDILLINRSKRVVGGSLREIKESYGRNRIALRISGPPVEFSALDGVTAITHHADETLLDLNSDADPQMILKEVIARGSTVLKFERVEPSLNDIFIDQVGGLR